MENCTRTIADSSNPASDQASKRGIVNVLVQADNIIAFATR